MSLLQLLLKPANRNLLEVVSHLPKLGVGSKVTRKSWEQYGNSYWEVKAVKPRAEDGSAGKVYGVLTWRGVSEDRTRLINGRAKRLWRWMPSQEQQQQYAPLARELQRQQNLQRLAVQKAEATAAAAGKDAGS
ncbi:hypothetical protein COO60DRAFT_1481492 [Scenedesmus sp. NREL 46B-D3]|nr:hypothetical protein COO60DRAFT_1481492 [Scenedesmus sp. NREL 46B-D3]